MFKKIILIFISLLFISCSDDTIMTKIYKEKKNLQIESINLYNIYPDIENLLLDSLSSVDIKIDTNSSYKLRVDYMNYKKHCNNPMSSAYNANLDGYIRLTLFDKNQKIYMCQKDFNGKLDKSVVIKLLNLIIDLK